MVIRQQQTSNDDSKMSQTKNLLTMQKTISTVKTITTTKLVSRFAGPFAEIVYRELVVVARGECEANPDEIESFCGPLHQTICCYGTFN